MKAHLVTLGCPKNLVDSEASLALLRQAGCASTDEPERADILIVNACSFLDAAWQETLEEVNRLAAVKAAGEGKKLILMGCLPKHREENLRASLPFVDRFIPTGGQATLPGIVREWEGEAAVEPDPAADRFAGFEERSLLTPSHTAYVKIAEGCSRRCTFCAIPKIRGRMVSRPVASIVREVQNLMGQGVKEVSLLAQDITSYNSEGYRFTGLVDAIAGTGIDWIRIFYLHPGSLSLELARRLFEHPAVCRYLEAPVQHASDRVLKRMRRPYTRARIERLFEGLRTEFPDLRVRSEVIVGFPGETDDDFDELKSFIQSTEFASLGVFSYSPESNTPAAVMNGRVERHVVEERVAELNDLQESITFGLLNRERGNRHRILVDRHLGDDESYPEGYAYSGRYYGQAYEVDGEVLLQGDRLDVGTFVDARITDSDIHDLRAIVGGSQSA